MEDTKKEVKKTTKKTTGTKNKTTNKKTTTAKKTTAAKKTTTKKQEKPVVKTIEENKVDIKNFDPKEVKATAIDTVEERDDIAEAIKNENKQEIIEIKKEVKELAKKEETTKVKDNEKIIDFGIVVVIIGLFILVLTTYLTSAIDLSYQEVNILVIISIAIEALGVAIVLVGSLNRK